MKLKNLRRNPFSRPKETDNKTNEEAEDQEPSTSTSKKSDVLLPPKRNFNHIKCKIVRQEQYRKFVKEKAEENRKAKKKRIQEDGPKQVPHTIESLREKDETTVVGELEDEDNLELKVECENDEFAPYYRQDYEPKVLITYADNPNRKTRIFGRELTRIVPNSISLYRNRSGVKKIVKGAIARNFTDIIIVNEDQCKPSILFIEYYVI